MVNITKRALSPFKVALRAVALTFVICATSGAWAVDYTGTDYEPWNGVYGAVAWRNDGSNFEVSKVADIAADGTIGEPYAMTWNATLATSGRRFCSAFNQSTGYVSPGMLLVYDQTGKTAAANATFTPLSFCGLWVKALANETTPYSVTGSGNRATHFGVAGVSSYFKFDKSFTVNRTGTTTFYGEATVEIAQGATFTAQGNANHGVAVDSAATLKLKGAGMLAVTTMTVNGTLDLSAETVPTISGNVTLAGTIVLPEGTEVSQESPFTVCSGTLSGLNVYVKIGNAEAVEKSFTAENGAITSLADPIYEFSDNFPTVVPAGKVYTFVGGATAETAVTVPSTVNVSGTLKTSGFITVPYFAGSNGAVLDVIDGTTTLTCGNIRDLAGYVVVEADATLVNGNTDAVDWNDRFIANVYGTLDMGATRWSLGSNNTLNFYEGCTVTGSGQSSNGTFDWIENATANLNVYGDVNLAAPIRIRSTATVNVNVDTTDQKGLTLADTIGVGKIVKKGAGLVKFTTNPSYPITVENGAFTFAVDATPTITYSAKPGAGTTMSMWYATQATWKGTVVLGVLSAPTALPLDTYGNANSKIELKGTTGSCYLNGTTTVEAEVVIDTDEDHVVEFNNGNSGQVGTFNKVSGSGTLKLTGWPGCSEATYYVNPYNFNGTLAIHNAITRNGGGTFTIGITNIVTTGATTPGSNVLNLTQTAVDGATGTVVYNFDSAQVNGVATDLEVKSDGIYVASSTVTVPAVANTTVTVKIGEETIGTAAGNYDVEPGAVVTVTYAAAEGYQISGTTVYTIDTASATTFTPSAQAALIVAYIGETPYTDLATAFAAVDDDDTLTLVGTAVTLSTDVTVEKSYTLAGDAEGTAVTGAGKIYLTGSVELTLDATIASVGNQFWFSSKDATLTFPTEGFKPTVRPYTAGGCQTGTTVNGDGTSTYYQYLFLQLQVGASHVTLAYDVSGESVVTKQVYEGDELVFTATPAVGYENVVVTVNGEPLAPVDGKYTVVVGTVNVAIQATATAMPVITIAATENGTVSVVAGETPVTNGDCVASGTTVTVTITPASKYKTDTVVITMGGEDVTDTVEAAEGTFAVTGDVSITVTFVRDVVTFTVQKPVGATVTVYAGAVEVPANPNGSYTVDADTQVSVEWTVGDDYKISGTTTRPSALVADGAEISAPEGMTVAKVMARISGDDTKYTSVIQAIGTVMYGQDVDKPGKVVTVLDDDWNHATYAEDLDPYWTWNPTDRTYTYKTFVARVLTTDYESLAEAVADAEAGQTVRLLANIALEATVAISKTLAIELDGYTITASNYIELTDRAATLTVSGVTLSPAPTTSVEGAKVKLIDGVYKVVYGTIFSIY